MTKLKLILLAIPALFGLLFALSAFAQEAPQSPVEANAAQLAAEGEALADEAAQLMGNAKQIMESALRIDEVAGKKKMLAQVLADVVGKWECSDLGDDDKSEGVVTRLLHILFNILFSDDDESEGVVTREVFVFDGYYGVQRSGRAASYITDKQEREFGGKDYLFEVRATATFSYSAERQNWNVTETEDGIHLFTGDGEKWEIIGKPKGIVLIKHDQTFSSSEVEQPGASLRRAGEGFLATVLNENQRFPKPNSRPARYLWEAWLSDCRQVR